MLFMMGLLSLGRIDGEAVERKAKKATRNCRRFLRSRRSRRHDGVQVRHMQEVSFMG